MAAEEDKNLEFASNLFKRQVNMDKGGYLPMDGRLGIAMNAILQSSTSEMENYDDGDGTISKQVGEEVMNAVEEMCLVSPTDQERCKLGKALVLYTTT
eukprot:10067471-Ditylum_brightwellii.AAC.1